MVHDAYVILMVGMGLTLAVLEGGLATGCWQSSAARNPGREDLCLEVVGDGKDWR